MTIPTVDPLVDAVTVSLVYANDGAATIDLVTNCPNLFNVQGAGASEALYLYLSPVLDRTANHGTISVYDITAHLDGSPHGSPVDGGTFTLLGGEGTPMPEGLAACVSYRADYGTDVEYGPHTRPRARDRNRHYFGPLTQACFNFPTSTARVSFASRFMTDCLANTKQVEVITGTGLPPDQWNLQVWSRKNASVKPVAEYWMDDRPDYQRRRSDQPGNKTFLPA